MSGGTRPVPARFGGLALALGLALAGVACDDDDGPPASLEVGGEEVPVTRLADTLQGVCLARRQAATGDVEPARRTFFDRSHDTLHVLAVALEEADRQKAGELLLAKQLVEADLKADPVRANLVKDLGRLAEVTRSGLTRLEISTPPCE